MFTRRAWLRLGLLSFLIVTFLSPIGVSAGSDIACDEFANPDAAQHLLDADDDYAQDLDPDGDGIACNEDENGSDSADASAARYLNNVRQEVDTWMASVEAFNETVDALARQQVPEDEEMDALEFITDEPKLWAEYLDQAPSFDVPSGYEEIDEQYQAWAESLVETGDRWIAYLDAPNGEEQERTEAFDDALAEVDYQAEIMLELVDDALAGLPEDAREQNNADDDQAGDALAPDDYLATVDEHFNELVDSFQEFTEILEGEVNEDDRDALYAIYATWAEAAEVASGIEAPNGYEDLHEAYLDVANGFTELYDLYAVWLETESGTDEDAEALQAYEEQVDVLNDLCVTLDQMLTDAS